MESKMMFKNACEWIIASICAAVLGLLADNCIAIILISCGMFLWGVTWLVVGYNLRQEEDEENKRLFNHDGNN